MKKLKIVRYITFLLFLFPISGFSASTCESEPTDMQIDYGELIDCKIDLNADTDFFRFFGEAGDRVNVVTNQTNEPTDAGSYISPCFEVVSPEGETIAEECTTGLIIGYSADFVLKETGIHTVSIYSRRNTTGDYHVGLTCLSGQCAPFPDCTATYDSATQIAHIPCIVVDGHTEFDIELAPPYNLLSADVKN